MYKWIKSYTIFGNSVEKVADLAVSATSGLLKTEPVKIEQRA